jgi:hypothetical protein
VLWYILQNSTLLFSGRGPGQVVGDTSLGVRPTAATATARAKTKVKVRTRAVETSSFCSVGKKVASGGHYNIWAKGRSPNLRHPGISVGRAIAGLPALQAAVRACLCRPCSLLALSMDNLSYHSTPYLLPLLLQKHAYSAAASSSIQVLQGVIAVLCM